MEQFKKPKSNEQGFTDFELLSNNKNLSQVKHYIQELKQQGLLESTIKNLQEEIRFLEERYTILDSERFSYDSDDKTTTEGDFDRVSQQLSMKKQELAMISQDEDILDATIKDIDEQITHRATYN